MKYKMLVYDTGNVSVISLLITNILLFFICFSLFLTAALIVSYLSSPIFSEM